MTTYRVVLNQSLCSGFASCLERSPSVFGLGTDGVAFVREAETDDVSVVEAAQACPMGAIAVTDATTGKHVA